MADTVIAVRSSWYCVDGVVMSADVLPKSQPAQARVTSARAEIRRQIIEARKR